MMNYRWAGNMGNWGGYGFSGLLPMLILWLIIILGIVFAVRYFGDSKNNHNSGNDSLNIVKERYAKGEINKKEFEEIKKDLSL